MAAFDTWIHDLETRHLSDLRFAEVSRALRALSSTYIERRATIHHGACAGRRRETRRVCPVLRSPSLLDRQRKSSAAWTPACRTQPCWSISAAARAPRERHGPQQDSTSRQAIAIDRNPWAIAEAAHTYRHFGVRVRTQPGRYGFGHVAGCGGSAGRILRSMSCLATLAIACSTASSSAPPAAMPSSSIEPVARTVAPWWSAWQSAFCSRWRTRRTNGASAPQLPDIVAKLDRAAGLDHRELTARSLWIPAR